MQSASLLYMQCMINSGGAIAAERGNKYSYWAKENCTYIEVNVRHCFVLTVNRTADIQLY